MKKKLLVVTEDIIEIQTFSGTLGNVYSFFCQLLLKLKLKLAIFILHRQYDVTVLATDQYFSCPGAFLSYSEQLDPAKMDAYKPLAWKIFKTIAAVTGTIDLISLWQNKITSRLMNYYLSYLELLTRLISSGQYSQVLILGSSVPEQIAKFLCRQYQRPLLNYSFFNFNFLTKFFFRFFRQRELSRKLNHFILQARQSKLPPKLASHPVLLSVDLFRHLKTLIPVYLSLDQAKANPLFVTDESLITSYLTNSKAENSRYIFLANFISPQEIEHQIKSWRPAKAINLQSKNIATLILRLAYPEISPIIQEGLILSKLYLLAGEKLFQTLKPKYVVVAADIRLTEMTLSYLAKVHSIPSITVSPRTIIFPDEPYQYNLTDFIAVTGLHAKNQLIKLHVPAQKIIVSGDPRSDYFNFLSKNFSAPKARLKLGIKPSKKKIILLISERPNLYLTEKEKRDFFLLVSQAVASHPDTILVVKPHPTEKKYRLLEELKQWEITNAIVSDNQKIELFDLLKLSSVVVMVWSMTGLEAMMMKKPVIIVNPHGKNFDKYIPYLKNKAAIEANTLSSLSKYLGIYSNHQNPATKKLIAAGLKFSRAYIKKPDGQAADRVAQALAVKPPSMTMLAPVT